MNFNDAQLVESICYQMRQSDWPRSRNRRAINDLFNGFAPFTEEEVQANDIQANYNDLTSVRKAHDGRGQMYSAILKPGNYFNATATIGPKNGRTKHSQTVTFKANRIMKRSMPYYELQRAKIAQAILHGIGPAVWRDRDHWRPFPIAIEDVLIPSGEASELPLDDLPLFALHQSLTAPSLIRLTRGPNRDPGWNMPVVEACLKWIDKETQQLSASYWPDMWSAEKWGERIKESSWYAGDLIPTIEVYDFYWWVDDGKQSGWKRRMIIDPWGTPDAGALKYAGIRKKGTLYEDMQNKKSKLYNSFLYSSGDKIWSPNKKSIVGFQFADLSAVAPFRYHTIRGLGFLLHDACHIQNRLSCKITEATFETLTMLMRVKSQDDVQRALKANLFNRGFVDETVQFIPEAERWHPETGLVEFGWQKNREAIDQGSSSMSQNQDMSKGVEKGQLQIMAELNATTAMLSAGLLQYYQYQKYEYCEILRRLFNRDPSCTDPDVKEFRGYCLSHGVPEEMISSVEGWEVEPERVMGAGNKTLEMAIAQQLLAMRPLYDAGPQRKILRDVTSAITDDAARAEELVPEEPTPSSTVHDTELTFNALINGIPVDPPDGVNAMEAAAKTLDLMEHTIQQTGPVGNPKVIQGLTYAAGYATHYIKLLEEDKNSKKLATALNSKLGKLGNLIKAMAQRMQEQQQKAAAANGNGGLKPEDAAKIAATNAMAKNKIALAKESHAQKTAQRQISFEQKLKQDAEQHGHDLIKSAQQHMADIQATNIEAQANARRMSTFEE